MTRPTLASDLRTPQLGKCTFHRALPPRQRGKTGINAPCAALDHVPASGHTQPMLELDVIIEDERWAAFGLAELAQTACDATLQRLGLAGEQIEVALLACDDERIAVLNGEFREKQSATNVLSWPAEVLSAPEDGGVPAAPRPEPDGSIPLGDIAIAYDTCLREAAEQKKPAPDHVTHLIVHGLLHLLGYDHERTCDAARMENLEVEILGNLGLPDPY